MTDAPQSGLRGRSVDLIRKAAALSERIGGGPPILAFSGGKDSQALYHLAEEAGAPFDFQGPPGRLPGVVDFQEKRCGVHGLTASFGRH